MLLRKRINKLLFRFLLHPSEKCINRLEKILVHVLQLLEAAGVS
jgi:hypothetical protein